jgi:hypothetical protein
MMNTIKKRWTQTNQKKNKHEQSKRKQTWLDQEDEHDQVHYNNKLINISNITKIKGAL